MNTTHQRGRLAPPQAGFTLIELLVVIAIIAILASILFPVFARVRENARRSSCQSNMKQLALGVMQYSQDYDERYPSVGPCMVDNAGAPADNPGWSVAIQPYVKSTQVLQCPSDKNLPGATFADKGFSDYFYNVQIGYTNATFGYSVPSNGSNGTPLKQSQIDFPSNTLLLGETGGTQPDLSRGDAGLFWAPDKWRACGNIQPWGPVSQNGYMKDYPDQTFKKHLEGANYAFTDGHVKWYTPEKITGYAPSGSNVTFRPNTSTCPVIFSCP